MYEALLAWYARHKRDLPWRRVKTPYHVWLSEIMAQQTRINALLPYYERFIVRFPAVFDLARADEADVLKMWEGLGYYSRARLLHRTARIVAEEYNGVFPKDADGLRKLPGIGDYTAGAIASICYGQKIPAVDGNALRVFARVRNNDADVSLPDTKKELMRYLTECMPDDAGAFNQAVMELGALVCIPKNPRCDICPITGFCAARLCGRETLLPVKAQKKARRQLKMTVLLVTNPDGEILVRRRTERLLNGLWEYVLAESARDAADMLDELGLTCTQITPVGGAVHIFTHLEWHMKGFHCAVAEREAPEPYRFVPIPVLGELALPSALSYYTEQAPVYG